MKISTALPCRVSVYEEDGKTKIATLRPTTLLDLFHQPELKTVAEDLRDVLNAPTRDEADRRLAAVTAKHRADAPQLADWLETNIPEGLTVFRTPPAPMSIGALPRHALKITRAPFLILSEPVKTTLRMIWSRITCV